MGLSESKIVLERLESACFEADSRGYNEIQGLVSDDEFLSLLNALWRQLSPTSRTKIHKSTRARPRKPTILPKADVTKTLLECFPRWENNIHTFFTDKETLALDWNHPIAGSYKYLLHLERRGQIDIWRARFLKVVFSWLLEATCGKRKQSVGVKRAKTIIEKSGIVNDSSEQIDIHLTAWGKAGRRLELLCGDFRDIASPDYNRDVRDDQTLGHGENNTEHLGFLFRLPEYVTDDYLRKLPLNGPKREPEIKRLKESILHADVEYNALTNMASRIFNFLWGLIKTSLAQEDFILQGGLMQCNHRPSRTPNGPACLGTPSNRRHELGNEDSEMLHSNPPLVAEGMDHPFGEADEPSYPGSEPSQHNLPDIPPQRPEITQSTSSEQAGIRFSISNTQSEHVQMDVDTEDFNPRPYLLFMPTPMAPVQNTMQPNPVPSHTQFLQQPQMPMHQTNSHSEDFPVDAAPEDFNPRPYLRFMSTPMEPIQPRIPESEFIMSPIQYQQQPHMALPQPNNGEQIPTSTTPYEFNPRPYLQYTPTAELSQSSQEYHHSHRDMLSQQTCLMHHIPQDNSYPMQADTAQGHAIDLQAYSPQMVTDVYTDGFSAQQHHPSSSSVQNGGNRSVGQYGSRRTVTQSNGYSTVNQLHNHASCSRPIRGFA